MRILAVILSLAVVITPFNVVAEDVIHVTGPAEVADIHKLRGLIADIDKLNENCDAQTVKISHCGCQRLNSLEKLRAHIKTLLHFRRQWTDKIISYSFISNNGSTARGSIDLKNLRIRLEKLDKSSKSYKDC